MPYLGDLRRKSFRGQDLHGKALGESDLRGADFTGADLHDAHLERARTGMRRGWAAGLVVLGLAASGGLGIATGIAGRRVEAMLSAADVATRATGVMVASSLFVLLVAMLWKGPRRALTGVFPVIVALALSAIVTAQLAGIGTASAAVAFLLLTLLGLLLVLLGALARSLAGTSGQLLFLVAAAAGLVAARSTGGGAIAALLVLAATIAGTRARRRHEVFPLVDEITRTLACHGGTSFRGADLRGVRFDGARLSATDFRGAKLEGAHFEGAKATLCRFDDDRTRRAR